MSAGQISFFKNVLAKQSEPVEIGAILTDIRTGRWRALVEAVRAAFISDGKKTADQLKKLLPAVTFSGKFNGPHKAECLAEHSGGMILDFDGINGRMAEVRTQLARDQYCLVLFDSPTGTGLKMLIRVKPDVANHGRAFNAAAAYFKKTYDVDADPSGKDVCRLCFVSYDPELIYNPAAAVFEIPPAQKFKPRPLPAPGCDDHPDRARIEDALGHLSADCPYTPWVEMGQAVHSRFPTDEGFAIWDGWSRTAPNRYEEGATARHWKSFKAGGGITIATLFKRAMDVGWKPPRKIPDRSTTKPANAGKPLKAQSNSSAQVSRDLETKFGPPYFIHIKEQTGETVYQGLNESYFAGLHAAQNIELWEPLERTFYKYEKRTGLYQDSTSDAIKQEISESILALGRAVNLIGLVRDRADRRLAAIASQLKGIIEKRDAFKKIEQFIHLANGVLVFRNDDADLTEFSPDYFSRNQSPITFDPNARCDRFLNELILPAVHPDDVAIIQKYIGLCLLGRNIIQRFLILDGDAGRGKSQLAIVIQHLVGLLNCTQLRTEHLHERFELYRYLKKTLLVGVDVPADFLSTKGATVIKGLVGGDILDAEQKNGTGCFPMEGTFCIVVTSNSRLRVRLEGDTGAWRRRLLIVRYEAPPPAKKIPDFGKTLVATEGPGILNWALQGLAALLRDVKEIGDMQLSSRQTGMVDSLLAESDSLRCFLRDCVMRSDTGDLTVSEIIQSYAEYCPMKGWNPMPITVIQRQVEALMLELFQTVKAHCIERDEKQQKGFHHVCFK